MSAESFKTVFSVSSASKTVSSETITRPKRKRKNEQVCGKSSVMFDTSRDKTLLKGYKYQWIGCEVESCKFWGHTACVGGWHRWEWWCQNSYVFVKNINRTDMLFTDKYTLLF